MPSEALESPFPLWSLRSATTRSTAVFGFSSPNAPSHTDLLGTILLAVLSGHSRYAHVAALRADKVNPLGLGMGRVCGEDSVRRAFQGEDPQTLAAWQQKHLLCSLAPVLEHPWILDVDVTIKTIYGHQKGAQVGYNPHKPGRPSHTYHTYLVAGFAGLWRLVDGLARHQRPHLI